MGELPVDISSRLIAQTTIPSKHNILKMFLPKAFLKKRCKNVSMTFLKCITEYVFKGTL